MNRDEFIGKLQLVYVGDRNAFDEIVEDNQKLKNEVVYSKVEIERLKNIISELEKWIKENNLGKYRTENVVDTDELLDKLKALKENNNE